MDSSLYNRLLGYNQFVYCDNNPSNYIDPNGENAGALFESWAASAWWLTLADGPFPVGEILYFGVLGVLGLACGIEILITVQEITTDIADQISIDTVDPDSFPDADDVEIKIDHIMDEHHPSSGKHPQKDKFPIETTAPFIERLIREAYQNAKDNFPDSIIKIQETRYYLEGTAFGQKIMIWYESLSKTITTAFPK